MNKNKKNSPPKKMTHSEQKTSLWEKLPNHLKVLTGIIAGIAALVGAIAGFSTTLEKCSISNNHSEPYSVEVKSLDVFPFSLKNSISEQDFLYWFLVRAQNQSRKPIHIEVSFQVRRGPAQVSEKPAIYTVNPKEEFSQIVDPGFEFLVDDVNAEVDADLEVTWKVSDEKKNILKQGTKKIVVLPTNILDWGLTTPEGKAVPKDFLIACLAAWVQTPYPTVEACTMQLLQSIESQTDPLKFANQWFSKCYDKLFKNSTQLKISSDLIVQMKGQQLIRLPSQILMEKHANPLEITLLLSALSRSTFKQRGLRLVMFVITEGKKISYLLSWAVNRNDWHAVDMTNIDIMEFPRNVELATSKINQCLGEHPEIIRTLDADGVFLGKKQLLIALDFSSAAKKYCIRSLPSLF